MNWINPLKKFHSNAKGQLPYGVSIAQNEALEKHVTKLNQVEVCTKKLQKEVKKLSDCILTVNRYESKMTTDLSNSILCQENDDLRNVIQDWHTFNCETNSNGEEFAKNIRNTVIEPIKKVRHAFTDVKNEVKKYEQMMNDCNKYSLKVQKYSDKEKTSQNIVKLNHAKEALSKAQEEFQMQTDVLQREIPLFIDNRIDYFQPSLAALIRSEALYWGDNVKSFNDHSTMIGPQSVSNHEYTQRQSERFATINALSIVNNE